jgi:DNA repair exonuclease SbcCD ATPase subunit
MIEGPFILDEPAKHVSEEYIINVGKFLKEINTNFNRQIIMVTHNTHLSEISDKRYVVTMSGGISNVNEYNVDC